jgi:hypothetical protein
MTMKALRTGILGTAAAVAIFAFPPVSNAEYYVPPGNSAVNQYTESVPTSGGPKNVGKGGDGAKPQKVLGSENTKRLEEHGEQGRRAAEVAATTAPKPVVTFTEAPASEPGQGGGGTGDGQGGGTGPGKQTAPEQQSGVSQEVEEGTNARAAEPSGSSGLGEVLGHATGSSSGGMGLLLPLILVAAIVWASLMYRRQRSRTAH